MNFDVKNLQPDAAQVKKLNVANRQKRRTKPRPKCSPFIKGPIPRYWLVEAFSLSPAAGKVGLVLWYLAGLTKSKTVVLTTVKMREFKFTRLAKYRGLEQLERAGLVKVKRRRKQNPVVTIIEKTGAERGEK